MGRPRYRLFIPANPKQCRHRDLVSDAVYTADNKPPYVWSECMKHVGAYIELYVEALDLWVECKKEEVISLGYFPTLTP